VASFHTKQCTTTVYHPPQLLDIHGFKSNFGHEITSACDTEVALLDILVSRETALARTAVAMLLGVSLAVAEKAAHSFVTSKSSQRLSQYQYQSTVSISVVPFHPKASARDKKLLVNDHGAANVAL